MRTPAARRFRPSIDSLETRQLLSGPSTAIHPAVDPAPSTAVTYRVVSLTHLNKFQDSVQAIRLYGVYTVSFTLGVGTVAKVGDLFHKTLPAVAGYAYMIVSKVPLKPGDTVGSIKVSQVTDYYNNKPSIKGLNYTLPTYLPLSLFNQVKEGDILWRVPGADSSKPFYWKPEKSLTENDKLLISEVGNKADGSSSLPNLRSGAITNVGPSTDLFNCYAYSAEPSNPIPVGWVAGDQGAPEGVTNVVPIRGMTDLINFYKAHGWSVVSKGSAEPTVPNSGMVAIYLNASGFATHAALVTPGGVYAKMGRLGSFKFSSLNQMSGGDFGYPGIWLQRAK